MRSPSPHARAPARLDVLALLRALSLGAALLLVPAACGGGGGDEALPAAEWDAFEWDAARWQ